MIFRQDAPSRYPSLSPTRYLARSALPRERFRFLTRSRHAARKDGAAQQHVSGSGNGTRGFPARFSSSKSVAFPGSLSGVK